MKNNLKKFLEFNGKAIYFQSIDGQYWIAIRPICEALNIQFSRQLKNIKKDEILCDVWSKQTMRDTKNRLQMMVALPEKYIYGWLFSINSSSDVFQKYKLKCYDLLFDYFQGSVTQRKELIEEKIYIEKDIRELEAELSRNEDYKKLMQLKGERLLNGKQLRNYDKKEIDTQLELFN